MKKYFLIYITVILASCGGPQGIIVSEADKETFKKNYESFEEYHLGGIYAEDIDLFLELYSDSLKWSGPNNYSGTYQTKAELTAAATEYFNQFEEFKFEPGVGPDNPGSYWGGSLYSDMGVETTDPNVVRIYGLWSFKHSETGAPLKLKFYIIQQFNEAGKVVMLNEWFDPSSIETQIQDYLEN